MLRWLVLIYLSRSTFGQDAFMNIVQIACEFVNFDGVGECVAKKFRIVRNPMHQFIQDCLQTDSLLEFSSWKQRRRQNERSKLMRIQFQNLAIHFSSFEKRSYEPAVYRARMQLWIAWPLHASMPNLSLFRSHLSAHLRREAMECMVLVQTFCVELSVSTIKNKAKKREQNRMT